MAEKQALFPCLKEPDWEGSDKNVCHRLQLNVDSGHLPWVAFGYDYPHTFQFLPKDALGELNKTERDIEREALRNLRLRTVSLEAADVKLGLFKKLRFLISAEDYFAAEKILDVGFMREVQVRLNAKGLAVGIPRRGVLIVTDAQQPMDKLGPFAGAVSTQYHRGDTAPITPAVFAVVDGQIVGMLQGGEDLGTSGVEEEQRAKDAKVYLERLVVREPGNGLSEVHICAGGSDPEALAEAIESAFLETLRHQLPSSEFGGEIRLVLETTLTPENLRRQMPSLVAHLQGVVDEAKARTQQGRAVRVSLEERSSSMS